jgi:hypothetical protein
LDQGIIAAYKLQYRRLWVQYILRQIEAGKNPYKTVNLLKAIQWTWVAWNTEVKTTTIQKYFQKSTLVVYSTDLIVTASDNIQASLLALDSDIQQLNIENSLSSSEFVEPIEEILSNIELDPFNNIVEAYTDYKDIISENKDQLGEVETPCTTVEALEILRRLKIYEESQENRTLVHLQDYERHTKELQIRRIQQATQRSITSYLGQNNV